MTVGVRSVLPSLVQRRVSAEAVELPALTSGGLLWRRRGAKFEVCLLDGPGGWSIPRGPVMEDERLRDAALRQVLARTGFNGVSSRPLLRLALKGEIAHLYLFHCRQPSRSLFHEGSAARWVPLEETVAAAATPEEAQALHLAGRLLDREALTAR